MKSIRATAYCYRSAITGNLLQLEHPEEDLIHEIGRLRTFPGGTRLTLISTDKPDRFFTVIKLWDG